MLWKELASKHYECGTAKYLRVSRMWPVLFSVVICFWRLFNSWNFSQILCQPFHFVFKSTLINCNLFLLNYFFCALFHPNTVFLPTWYFTPFHPLHSCTLLLTLARYTNVLLYTIWVYCWSLVCVLWNIPLWLRPYFRQHSFFCYI